MKLILNLFVLLLISYPIQSQIFLQLEEKNNPQSKKISINHTLIFKLYEYPKDWRTQKIFDILPKENTIIFDENFFKPEDISHIQFLRPWTRSLGDKMMIFSSAYFLYGGIATVAYSDFDMTENQVVLGGAIATTGFLLRTLFYKRTIKLGKNFRLRIVDIRMSEF